MSHMAHSIISEAHAIRSCLVISGEAVCEGVNNDIYNNSIFYKRK